jgi:methylisocitrate lyase
MTLRAARRMRELISRPGMVEVPGVHDVLSAKIAEQLGFEALYIGSSLVAAASYGLPDIGIGKHFADSDSGDYDFGREKLVPVEQAAANIRAAVEAALSNSPCR